MEVNLITFRGGNPLSNTFDTIAAVLNAQFKEYLNSSDFKKDVSNHHLPIITNLKTQITQYVGMTSSHSHY
jgi:hypothetical protein